MCWMTVRHEDDALAKGLIETRQAEKHSGGHSWGYAYYKSGNLVINRELGTMPEDFGNVPVADVALVHTRLGTRGMRHEINAHPFSVLDSNGQLAGVIAHNGTWYQAPNHEFYSDTWFIRQKMEEFMDDTDSFQESFIATAEETGETLIGLTADGVGYAYSGRFDIKQDDNIIQSSGVPSRILKGQVVKTTHDGAETIERNVGSPYRSSRYGNTKYYGGSSDQWEDWQKGKNESKN